MRDEVSDTNGKKCWDRFGITSGRINSSGVKMTINRTRKMKI